MLGELAARAAADLARLAVPVACPGCGAFDVRLCGECAAPWWEPPVRVETGAPRLMVDGTATLPVWAVVHLEGPAAELVRAWKDGARRDLDRWLAGAMRLAAARIGPELRGTRALSETTPVVAPDAITVVPAPARAASTRRRGVDLPSLLARAAAQGLTDAGVAARCERALAIAPGESRGRTARARWRGARGGVRVRRRVRGPVLLVDDVVTTGATLASCAAALEERGGVVIGAIAAASAGGGRRGPRVPIGWDPDDD